MLPVIPKINNTTNTLLNINTHLRSYRKYFCRQCYSYNCQLHDYDQPLPANHGVQFRQVPTFKTIIFTKSNPRDSIILNEVFKLISLKEMNILKTVVTNRNVLLYYYLVNNN